MALHLCRVLLLAYILEITGGHRIQPSRRMALTSAGALSSTLLRQPERALAVGTTSSTLTLADKLQKSAALTDDRMPISLALRPSYGLELPDVYYPPWVLGRWAVTSTLRSVYAPAGDELFAPGRNGTDALKRARSEARTATPLAYDVRWRRSREPKPVLDREFNVASITRASMGANSVQNVEEDGPDHRTLLLRPDGSPSTVLFSADIRVVARRVDPYPRNDERPNLFACAETTRQTVTTVAGETAQGRRPQSPLVKEVETICTYELDPQNPDVMRGGQRTATFLVPDAAYTGDPSLIEVAASRLTLAPNGQLVAVDVRNYDLVYTRV